jgi:hypothetical protein
VPPHLVTPADPELVALLAPITSPGDGTQGSGAADWAQFAERMHFIATLFRTHAEDTSLFEPPFTPQQVAVLDAGRRPEGQL